MINHALIDFLYHKKSANVLDWSPLDPNLIVSGSNDRKVFLWDLSKAGEEQARTDYEVGPPELLFPHECHDYGIEAVHFSRERENFVATADTSGTLQVWKMRADV
jgi:histone-binding protein RBBP4